MKTTLTILGFFVALSLRAQSIEYVKVIPVDSTQDSFAKARMWVGAAFASAKDVIQYESDDAILCKGNIALDKTGGGANGTIHETQAGHVNFAMEIGIKKDRVRIRIFSLVHEAKYGGGALENEKPAAGMFMSGKTWASVKKQTEEKIQAVIASFEQAMTSNGEDW